MAEVDRMEKCWICRRTKGEIIEELIRMESGNANRKAELEKEIEFIRAEESDFPTIYYCSVCDSVLTDFILKEGVVIEEEDAVDDLTRREGA
ncbi:MAG: hypothetical protein AABW68_03640 [archaeon]|mgnify:CR=1 FL=1